MGEPRSLLDHLASGFRVWRMEPQGAMPAAHTHPDIEFNFLHHGFVSYLQGGAIQTVRSGRLAVFWGGAPHQTLDPGVGGAGIWITLPLAWFLQWQMPYGLADRLLSGELLQANASPGQMEQWLGDYDSNQGSRRRALLLEMEAWLLRLASSSPARSARRGGAGAGASHIERIVGCLGAHYHEDILVADIARAVRLHPKYLMRLFKQHCRMGVWEYLTRLRVSHAQRLLVTTEARVTDLALESGFGSPAPFYQAFAAYAGGETPLEYRRRHREPGIISPPRMIDQVKNRGTVT